MNWKSTTSDVDLRPESQDQKKWSWQIHECVRSRADIGELPRVLVVDEEISPISIVVLAGVNCS
jgi:hypothetical protein